MGQQRFRCCRISTAISFPCSNLTSLFRNKKAHRKGGGGRVKKDEDTTKKDTIPRDLDRSNSNSNTENATSNTTSPKSTAGGKPLTPPTIPGDPGLKFPTNYKDESDRVTSMPSTPVAEDAEGGEDNKDEEEKPPTPLTKKRKVSFKVGFTEAVHEIPNRTEYEKENLKEDLFYLDADYERFRASEQKRHDKLVAKKIQKMVMEKMQPTINEAVANGATLEDIEAMVPKTHEEMVAYLGGEESIRRSVDASNFTKLHGKETNQETLRTSRSSISIRKNRTAVPSDNNTSSELGNENETELQKESKPEPESEPETPTTARKRTIRCSRDSIQIKYRNTRNSAEDDGWGSPMSDAAAEAAAASEELILQEEKGLLEE